MKHSPYILLLSLFISTSSLAQETWRGLLVSPENRCVNYDKKKQYPYPQSVEDTIVRLMDGLVYGPYTGRYFESDRETDIEHIVASSEGHNSGLCSASSKTRKEFATDPLNLTLASPNVNRCSTGGKCGFDAAEWLPKKNQCWFADRVFQIKTKYSLSVDVDEAKALEGILSKCNGRVAMIFYDGSVHSNNVSYNPVAKPVTGDALTLYDDNNNGRITCAEANRHGIAPVYKSHASYKFMRDGNNDGVVCK
jgi:hypothetical protein